jgi:hypothetical protein
MNAEQSAKSMMREPIPPHEREGRRFWVRLPREFVD